MTSRADLDAYVQAQADLRALAARDLAAWWATLTDLSPSAVREEAARFVPLLVRTYGEASAAVAADWYDDMRAASGARGRYEARMADGYDERYLLSVVDDATRPLLADEPDYDRALSRLSTEVDRLSQQVGKRTLIRSGERDPARPRWARVPSGKTCAWCLMLASRGAVYRSAASAGEARDFHSRDDCQPVMSWRGGRDLPEDYDEGALYDLYARARTGTGGDQRAILANLRRLDGGRHVTDGVPL